MPLTGLDDGELCSSVCRSWAFGGQLRPRSWAVPRPEQSHHFSAAFRSDEAILLRGGSTISVKAQPLFLRPEFAVLGRGYCIALLYKMASLC
jgi:hypothetical protein